MRRSSTVTRQTLDSQSVSYKLIKQSLDAGATTALVAAQAATTVDTAQANVAAYTRQAAQDRNTLMVLIGGPLPDGFKIPADLDAHALSAELPADIPSQVLTARPDVMAAEHQLIAANANIGAARAAFFPSITLTGSYGTASPDLSGLFKQGSEAWVFAPQISLPIFTGGCQPCGTGPCRGPQEHRGCAVREDPADHLQGGRRRTGGAREPR